MPHGGGLDPGNDPGLDEHRGRRADEARQRALMAVLQVESVLTVWATGAWLAVGEPLELLTDAVCHLLAPALDDGRSRG